MRRRLLNLLTLLSLLLCAVVVALLLRSSWISDWVAYSHVFGKDDMEQLLEAKAITGSGNAVLIVDVRGRSPTDASFRSQVPYAWVWDAVPEDPAASWPRNLGFGFDAVNDRALAGGFRQWIIGFPLWVPAGLLGVLPAVQLYGHCRRRYRTGRCAQCGYDLRATPDRCPECGAVP